MTENKRIFEFEYDDNIDVVIAKTPQQAIIFYINDYADDLIDDIVRFGSIKIEEVIGVDITKKRQLYNKEIGKDEEISYWDVAKEFDTPSVIVTTNY